MKLDPLFCGPGRLTTSTKWTATIGFVVGALLVIWSAYIHFDLWQSEGYRHIPTIGPLFIFQAIAALVIGVAVVAIRRVWVAVLGAGFAISTMVGFLLSVEVGLFGFQDTWSAPYAHQAFFVEVAAAVVLIVAGALCVSGKTPRADMVAPRNRTGVSFDPPQHGA
jgi:UDP-N-acetylmuramyl pentapeptide phosphotransferase/UDP-N-acetylglucosamine-1-phosphate transferase